MKLIKVEQVAEQLMVSRSTVFGLIRDGELASVKIGRSRRVPVDALDDYVARLSSQHTHSA